MTDPDFLASLLVAPTPANLYDLLRAHRVLRDEVLRLRQLTNGLAERVAGQSELLTKKAEASET